MNLRLRRIKTAFKFRVLNPLRYLYDEWLLAIQSNKEWQNTTYPTSSKPVRLLLLCDNGNYTSDQQFNVFQKHRHKLRKKLRLISVNLLIDDVQSLHKRLLTPFDIIGIKLSFNKSPSEAERIVSSLSDMFPTQKIIYFDGDDDLCVQWPALLKYVTTYIKKHVFSDRSEYQRSFVGKSNLTDYVHHLHGVSFSENMIPNTLPVPVEYQNKVILGYNIAMDAKIEELSDMTSNRSLETARPYDIACRASIPSDWTYQLRNVTPLLEGMKNRYQILAPVERVSQAKYYEEMLFSKIYISPFGYGEICWRDFEAVLCGCLLIKPDMSHIKTNPDIFQAGITYIPIRWDFSDLEDKCAYYLDHENERKQIVSNARAVLTEFYNNEGIIKIIADIVCL
ncbi:glycosyltransferase [Methylomonas sp. AM2-LC]|uniref:glycosyltransferase n=1 Tax=Methylomonas sp. AM2-LC TaxID=3153301 RepID=UPI003265667E